MISLGKSQSPHTPSRLQIQFPRGPGPVALASLEKTEAKLLDFARSQDCFVELHLTAYVRKKPVSLLSRVENQNHDCAFSAASLC